MSKNTAKVPKLTGSANTYDHRNIVLEKVCGHPPWPGMVRVLNIVKGASGANSGGYPGS
ncbi:hypothetical protein ARMGADRAFT_925081 [Armillaria gallica]|uniref:PWWP domain-containing protein n=1 Tax=Armillaria gallica TaxID=47427 RepID=A0A2H3DQN8_ARMGA|nr:hypothetical protein ARMGADRAFT_925081 [Armillaria gallica]